MFSMNVTGKISGISTTLASTCPWASMVTEHSWPGSSASLWKNLWSGSQAAIAICSSNRAVRQAVTADLVREPNWSFAYCNWFAIMPEEGFCASANCVLIQRRMAGEF